MATWQPQLGINNCTIWATVPVRRLVFMRAWTRTLGTVDALSHNCDASRSKEKAFRCVMLHEDVTGHRQEQVTLTMIMCL